MSVSTSQDLLLDLPDTFGALFVAGNLAAILFGLSNIQSLIYFQTHRGTGITFLKLIIICLWTLDAFHLTLIIHSVYHYLVTDYVTVTAHTEIIWSFKLQIVIDDLIIYVVQLLYVYRIWIVSKGRSRVLPITVGIIAILVLGIDIVMFWALYRCHVIADLVGIVWMTFMTLGAITFVDFVVALSLCYLLATSRTGFSSTDSILTKLITYTINTGCLTSVVSIAVIITCAAIPWTFIFLGIEFLMPKLYVNSFLALLNARYYLQSTAGTVNSSKYQFHRGVYPPDPHVNVSQDENSRASRKNIFDLKPPDEEALRSTRPVQVTMSQRPTEITIEMDSFSSV